MTQKVKEEISEVFKPAVMVDFNGTYVKDSEEVKWVSVSRTDKESFDKAMKENNQGNVDYEKLIADLKKPERNGGMFRGNYFYRLFDDGQTVGRFKTHKKAKKNESKVLR